ncbi:MAG TPA: hypothetical protein VIZ68_05125, partial [Thermoplasmata archaeon]
HLGTAFLIVLPTRHRVLIALAPWMALGLDADHLFGSAFPTVLHREAHDLVFVLLIALAVGAVVGRAGAFAAAGAALQHLAVDGGVFPLLAPASMATYPIPWPVNIGVLTIAAALLFLTVRGPADLARPRYAIPLVLCVGLVAALQSLIPGLGLFDPG